MSDATSSIRPWALYRPAQRRGFLAVLFLVSMSSYADRQVMAVLIEPIKHEFGASDAAMGLLGGFAFALFYATLGIPVARLADRGNRKLVITLSLVAWSALTMLCGVAQSFPQLFAARIGVGAGEAGSLPPAQSLIADYFPPQQRARALGIFLASATAGYLIAFVGGAKLAALYGWRYAFLALGAPGLLLVLLAWFGLAEPRKQLRIVAGVTQEPIRATFDALRRKPSFVLICIAAILYWLVAYGAVIWLPAYMVRVLKVDLAQAGAVYGALGAISALIGSVAGGWLTDTANRRGAAGSVRLFAIILMAAAPVYILAMTVQSIVAFYLASFVGSVALSASVPAFFTTLLRICGPTRRATAVAILFFFANLIGLGLGPVITGAMSDYFSGQYGAVGLRYALSISFVVLVPSGWAFWQVSHHVERDGEADETAADKS